MYTPLFNTISKAVIDSTTNMTRDFYEVSGLSRPGGGSISVDSFIKRMIEKSSGSILYELKRSYCDAKYIIDGRLCNVSKYNNGDFFVINTIDSIEGFVRGIGSFVTSVTYFNAKKELQAVLMYLPLTKDIFWAQKGQGAWTKSLIGAPRSLRVSEIHNVEKNIVSTLARFDFVDEGKRILDDLLERGAAHITDLSMYMNFINVASGKVDCFIYSGKKPTDMYTVFGGMLLVNEAGGRVVNIINGNSYTYSGDSKSCDFMTCSNYMFDFVKFK